jgi:hypothetical protein
MGATSTKLLCGTEVTCLSRRLHEELNMDNEILGLFSYDEKENQIECFADMFKFLND